MTTFRVILRAVALALIVPSSASAQATPTAPPTEPSLRTFFTDLAADVRRLPSNPAAVGVAFGAIMSSSLAPLDDDLARWESNAAFESGTWLGNGGVLAAGTLLAYGVGEWTDRPRVKRVTADLLRAQVLSLGIVYGMKYAVGRPRPDGSSEDSFPSGHSAQTFASAMVLARHLGPIGAWPAFAAAGFVAVSRVNQGRHYASDVAFGAGLGMAVGWTTAHVGAAWTVAPTLSPSTVGVQFSRVFQ